MAKNQSNTEDWLSKLETLASRLEKTNSNLGEKVGEMIKAQASSKTTETKVTEELEKTQEALAVMVKAIAELMKITKEQKQGVTDLKETVNTNTGKLPKEIKIVVEKIESLSTKQEAVDKKLNEKAEETSKIISKYKLNDRIHGGLLIIVTMFLVLLLYKYDQLERQVETISGQLQTIYFTIKEKGEEPTKETGTENKSPASKEKTINKK